MAMSSRALVKPELLRWARGSARLSLEDAAQRAQVSAARLHAWEAGEERPTVSQLRKLAKVCRRPLAVFYLARPPKDFDAPHDFRRLAPHAGEPSPELAFELRRARARREIALDLYRDLVGEDPEEFPLQATTRDDPERVAEALRARLGVRREHAASWKSAYDAFNAWRHALEDVGVLVFQAEDVTIEEMRGFSVSERLFPIVVVNIKDAPEARTFSMLHEVTHLMLREGGLCDLRDRRGEMEVEVFCNHVAGAALMPPAWLLAEPSVQAHKGSQWPHETIVSLSRGLRVSREVVVRRLLVLGRTTADFYRRKRQQYAQELEQRRELAQQRRAAGLDRDGFAPPDRVALSRAGPRFARLVVDSYHQEKITANDLASFLDIRLKHLPKIEAALAHKRLSRPAAGA